MITTTAKIYITDTDIIEINRTNIVRIESSLFDRGDLKLPSFGVISNTGRVEFNDKNDRVLGYAESLMLIKGLKCEIYITNTLISGASQKVGEYETDEWDYDTDNKRVSVTLKDDLEEWQEINVPAINYDARNPQPQSLEWFYRKLWETTTLNSNYKMVSFDELDQTTQTVFKSMFVKYALLKSGSLWASWQKFCEVGQSHIYKENGLVKCRYNGGN